ncbi:hypothetical protein GCM10009776_04430 [Microbacterium deminutum]|uniref:Uncharacterized protein n=1 Tax=Microbacterium deminutum TaxID=344164 RepID=A0ABP5BM38_9MICO
MLVALGVAAVGATPAETASGEGADSCRGVPSATAMTITEMTRAMDAAAAAMARRRRARRPGVRPEVVMAPGRGGGGAERFAAPGRGGGADEPVTA